jgi:hypothetical protein
VITYSCDPQDLQDHGAFVLPWGFFRGIHVHLATEAKGQTLYEKMLEGKTLLEIDFKL